MGFWLDLRIGNASSSLCPFFFLEFEFCLPQSTRALDVTPPPLPLPIIPPKRSAGFELPNLSQPPLPCLGRLPNPNALPATLGFFLYSMERTFVNYPKAYFSRNKGDPPPPPP